MFDMYAGEPSLTELERKMIFVAELGEKSGNPFFYRGVYRGETKEDMLAFNSSIFLSIDQSKCEEIAGKLRENGVLLIRSGEEGTARV